MTLIQLEEEALSAALNGGEKGLYETYLDLDNRYRIGPLYWQAAERAIKQEAQRKMEFIKSYPEQQFVFAPVVKAMMNFFDSLLSYIEKMKVIGANGTSLS